MKPEASMHRTSDDHGSYGARLTAEALPAFVIDCATCEVLAANASGLVALGLTRADRLPHALDSAMPAIATLRRLLQHDRFVEEVTPLVFWKNGRAVTAHCRVTSAGAQPLSHVLIVIDGDAVAPVGPAQSPLGTVATRDSVAANDDRSARLVRDDHETLKEIARRIREGQITAALAAGAALPSNDRHALSDRNDAIVVRPATPSTPAADDTNLPLTDPQPSTNALASERVSDVASKLPNALAPTEIAKLAHELKTPLTAIAAAAEIMRDEQLGVMGNEKYLGYAADIHSSATHALAVIGDMLATVGDEQTKALATAAFDLTELALSTVSSLQPLAAQRGLTLVLDTEPNLTPIRANATAIRQILLNLLTNALKFTPAGGEVRVVTGYLNDGAVFMVVRDTGDGIDQATIAHTFDAGPDRMTQRAGGGRGIGLRLVRRLAAENGAEFEIDSAPGRGTVVMLAFAKDRAGDFV